MRAPPPMSNAGEAISSTSCGEVFQKFEERAPEVTDAALIGGDGATSPAVASLLNGGGSSSSGE